MSKNNNSNSLIGEQSNFQGRFMVKGPLRIEGQFEGQASEVEQLFVGEKGKVLMTNEKKNKNTEENAYFEERFMVKGTLRIEGKFEGQVLEVEQLFVGAKGKVKSNIYANTVDVEGLVIGNIEAKNRVFLRPTSKVLGNIKTKELIVQNGVVLEGSCIIGDDFEESLSSTLVKFYNEEN